MAPESQKPFEESQETQLNAVDAGIVSRLQEDARAPLTQIADELDLSEAYVRRRLRLLLDHDVLAITAVADPRVFGLESMAWIGLEVEHAKAADVAERLLHLPDVDYVVVALGRFRVMAEVACESIDHLYQVVRQLRQLPSVRRIETFIYMRLLRQQFVWQTAGAVHERVPVQWQGASQHLDKLDLSIIRALQHDGRASFRELAASLGITQRAASSRYKALVESGVVRIAAVVNPSRLGLRAMAWLGIQLSPNADLEKVGAAIGSMPEVSYLVVVSGRFDLMGEVVATNYEELMDLLQDRVGGLEGIGSIEMMPYTKLLYKSPAAAWGGARTRAAATDATD